MTPSGLLALGRRKPSMCCLQGFPGLDALTTTRGLRNKTDFQAPAQGSWIQGSGRGSGDWISNRLPQVLVMQPVCGPASNGKLLNQAAGCVPKDGAGLRPPWGILLSSVYRQSHRAPMVGMAVRIGVAQSPFSARVLFTLEGPPQLFVEVVYHQGRGQQEILNHCQLCN